MDVVVQNWNVSANVGSYYEMNITLLMQKVPNDIQGFAERISAALNSSEVKKAISKQIGLELDQERVISL